MYRKSARLRRASVAVAAAAVLPLVATACSSDSGDSGSKSSGNSDSSQSGNKKQETKKSDMSMGTFGPACSSVPKSGKGSFNGMAKEPVATAASHNPELSTLVSAVKKAGLTDTLNSSKNITVFAPSNDAFDKVPKADLDKLLGDKKKLTKVLTYHVVGKPLGKEQLKSGSYDTLAKQKLTTKGSGDSYKVNDSANVGCGNVKTSNAKVHIIDNVLMPK